MKSNLYRILLCLFPFLYSFAAHTQNKIMDSVQQILKSVQNKIGRGNMPGLDFDSGDDFIEQYKLNDAFNEVNKALAAAKDLGDVKKLRGSYYKLSLLDSIKGDYRQAFEHYKLYTVYRDSLMKEDNEKKALQAKMQYEFDKKQAIAKAEQEKKDMEQKRIKNLQYFAIAGLAVLLLVIVLIALIQWKNNRQRKKANSLLQQQKEKIELTLTELKSTQSQLIHSEKMASLGELTAGIAHEIQNPLNFVNNFSEINKELLVEMKDEADRGNINEVKALANNVIENEEKINHHGKRADAIVKGMLQHSRSNTTIKEATDLNALADEYLHLSYHGLRAKNTSFNAAMKTDFDDTIGKIKIIPQDIGRMLLNMYNNAFYAVNEKAKEQLAGYEPLISVTTKKIKNPSGAHLIELTIADNGKGVPQKVIDKIFQPFFTTKPTGQGTGLGLSLSYDIVKAHGGEINVDTRDGEGSKFIITLPAD